MPPPPPTRRHAAPALPAQIDGHGMLRRRALFVLANRRVLERPRRATTVAAYDIRVVPVYLSILTSSLSVSFSHRRQPGAREDIDLRLRVVERRLLATGRSLTTSFGRHKERRVRGEHRAVDGGWNRRAAQQAVVAGAASASLVSGCACSALIRTEHAGGIRKGTLAAFWTLSICIFPLN